MRKKAPYTGQLLTWLVGLIAGWPLWLLLMQPAKDERTTNWPIDFACISPWEESDEFDDSSTASIQARSILLNSLSGFSFGPSSGFLSYARCVFHRISALEVSGHQQEAYWVFSFLHLIFEHQIAINAP